MLDELPESVIHVRLRTSQDCDPMRRAEGPAEFSESDFHAHRHAESAAIPVAHWCNAVCRETDLRCQSTRETLPAMLLGFSGVAVHGQSSPCSPIGNAIATISCPTD